MAAIETDLTPAGSQTTIGGAVFLDSANVGSGTGNYNTFLAVGDNDGNELGFNSGDTPPLDASNNDIDHAKTHTVLLSTVPVTVINGVEYYEFRVDLNEANSDPNGQISLDAFKIYTSSSGAIESKAVLDAQAAVVYDMDAAATGGDRTLLLSEVSTGSGTDDYAVLVPVANFAGKDPATTFMYLYVEMGFKGGDYQAQSGFEEWNLQTAGTLTGTKFEDADADGVKDAGETGVPGVTIFIDTDKDGILDAGERSTVTDANGNYTFFGVALGTYQIDEVVPAGQTQTTGAFETATIGSLGQIVIVDPIGNFIPTPSLNIVKDVSSVSDGPDAFPGAVANGAGDVVNYAIAVQNTGNVTLTGVVVTDPFADAGSITLVADAASADGELDVGETWHYTATHTVTQAEIDSNGGGNGALENVATADSNQTGPDTDDATVPVVYTPALNIVKDVSSVSDGPDAFPGAVVNGAGDVINYAIAVQNTGNVTLTGVTVNDPYANAGSITLVVDAASLDGELDVGETWHYTAAHTVLQSEIDSNGGGNGQLENIATADSNQTGPDTDDATVPVVYTPALNIVKDVDSVDGGTADGKADSAGDVINYAIAVQNTGNVTLTGVTVNDPYANAGSITLVVDAASLDGELDVGETWHYTAAHTVLQSEIDSNGGGNGQLENIATADSDQTGEDTDDASVPVVFDPSLKIVKEVDFVIGGPGGNVVDSAGDVIVYFITVENTGNVTLTGLVEKDDYADLLSIVRLDDVVGNDDDVFEVGEKWAFAAAHTVTQAEIDSNGGGDGVLENIATADSNETGEDDDDANVQVVSPPSLNIVKDVSSVSDGPDAFPGAVVNGAGDVINYAIAVQNTGFVTLTGVVVTDPFADAGSITLVADAASADGELDVGETWHYTATHTVTQAEIDSNGGGNGALENVATADSNQTGPDTDDATVPVVYTPALNIVKDVSSVSDGPDAFPGAVVNGAGDVINYAIAVQNTGNVTLTGVTVNDPYANAGSITLVVDAASLDGELDVGETWHYTAAHTVLQSEIDSNGGGNGQLENIATADSDQTGPDTDDASVPLVYDPDISIDKAASIADGHADQAGDIINYTVLVTNTGNVTLSNVEVTDSFEGALDVVLTNSDSFDALLHTGNTFDDPNDNGALDVGETWTYTYQHVVTQNELDTKGVDGDGSLDNIATVTTTSPDLGPLEDSASIPILIGPGVRTPGFWSQTNWKKFWDGIEGNEPSQAGTNGFADGEITTAVVNSLGDHRVDTDGNGVINAADNAPAGKVTAGLLIGDFDLNGIENGGEHAFFISTSDALTLLSANQKQLQNAEYQEGRALVATWLNYLAGNPIEAGDPTDVDAKDAIQWGVDWMLKTTQQIDGNISLADMNSHAVTASSAAWNVGIDGPDGGTTPTAYATLPQYDANLDIPGGAQILGVLDEYNNHGTVYGTVIATA